MAGGREDIDDEIEALECIYPDKLNITERDPFYKFSIILDGQPPKEISFDVSCKLSFELTEDYPDAAPNFDVSDCEGLLDSHVDEINTLLNEIIEQNLGMPMIFNLISETQEKLNTIAENISNEEDEETQKKEREREEEEKKKFIGTIVTVETFVKWKMKFDEEMSSLKSKEVSSNAQKRLTGKELFLKDNTFDDSDLQLLQEMGGDTVEVDESLFEDELNDFNLDEDFSDDDDDDEDYSPSKS